MILNETRTDPVSPIDPFDDDELIEKALRAGARDALLQHKRAGISIIVRQGDSLVEVPADQIEIRGE